MPTITVEEGIYLIQKGGYIIIVDEKDREDEGDLMIAAEHATPEKLAFFINYAKGLMCIPITKKRLDELNIGMMIKDQTDPYKTPFTVSVDAVHGTTTGISVQDRMKTIKVLLNRSSGPWDLARPGHLFPLKAHEKGVLGRKGHTEAAVDLCRAAGLYPMAVIAEIMNEDGSMSRMPQLEEFSKRHNIPILAIKSLCEYMKTDANDRIQRRRKH